MIIEHCAEGLCIRGLHPRDRFASGDVRAHLILLLNTGDEGVCLDDDTVVVNAAVLRALTDDQIRDLGIKKSITPLHVQENGFIRSGGGYRWQLLQNAVEVETIGPWVFDAQGPTLMTEAQEELVERSKRIEGATERFSAFPEIAAIQTLAAQDTSICLSKSLLDRKIIETSMLRIDVEVSEEGLTLPVPRLVSSERDGAVHDLSADDIYRISAAAIQRDTTVMLGGRHVVIPAAVARNALVTVAARNAPHEQRQRFLENPLTYLSDEDAFDEADYSSRVIGIGVAPSLASAATASPGRNWAGEAGDLIIPTPAGDLVVAAAELTEFASALGEAADRGEDHLMWDGHRIPTAPHVVDAVKRAIAEPAPKAEDDEDRPRPRILLIADNESSLDWAPAQDSRRTVRQTALPQLKVELKDYQQSAISRLQELYAEGGAGALLCDDMGLGKTFQALVFAAWVHAQLRSSRSTAAQGGVDIPVCVVAPPSLLEGWLTEVGARLGDDCFPSVLWGAADQPSHTPRKLHRLHGFITASRTTAAVIEDANIDIEAIRDAAPDILFIPYDTLRRLQFAIGKLHFGLIIADEVHEAKDPNSLRSRALRAMKADFRLGLTGTPVENRWLDLWTVADFAIPGHLGARQNFSRDFVVSDDTLDVEVQGQKLAERMQSVLIRRTRENVLGDLPNCTVTPHECPMPEQQRLAYDAERARIDNGGVLSLIQRLGAISLHPYQQVPVRSKDEAEAWASGSARTQILWQALRQYREEGSAVLVFVRSIAMQQTLQRALLLSFSLPHVGIMNGRLAQGDRHQLVNQVRNASGFRVLLISPDVGGAGWNLQFATRTVLLERPFNPAVESQMIARTHRLGQTRPVEVVVPIATHPSGSSYDQILAELLKGKEHLASAVLAPQVRLDRDLGTRLAAL